MCEIVRQFGWTLALLAQLLTSACSAQDAVAPLAAPNAGFTVHLEAHDRQTKFWIGDLITLDLVFTAKAPGYSVDTDVSPNLPAHDLIYVAPDGGWLRSHKSETGSGFNGNALVKLGSEPVRVPIVVNRTILFEEPGHYEVSVASERLRFTETLKRVAPLDDCNPCAATNAVAIDLSAYDETAEGDLVRSLTQELETAQDQQLSKPTPEAQKLSEEMKAYLVTADSSEESKERGDVLMQRMAAEAQAEESDLEKKNADRRLAAERLAYLEGEEALRAKVQIIAADKEDGSGDSPALILVDGLPSSRNKQLQVDLLEAAWRDPNNLPTYVLHTALRIARELARGEAAKNDEFGGTEGERKAAVKQYQADLDVIIATLPQRSEANRAQTIEMLRKIAIPNPFNQGQSTSQEDRPQ